MGRTGRGAIGVAIACWLGLVVSVSGQGNGGAPAQAALLRAVTDALPNVTGVRVEDVLTALSALLDQVAAALAATGALTLVTGAIVLVGAMAAGQRRRMREAVILRGLGATRAQVRAAWLVEFGLLGLTAGCIAAIVGSAASWAVAHYILHTQWVERKKE